MLWEADDTNTLLEKMPVDDLWGIGRQYAKFLKTHGITTALQLKHAKDGWVQKHLTIVGLRLVYELRGVSCLPIETVRPLKKGICTSRSFSKRLTSLENLKEAVANFAARCAEKLRNQASCAGVITVFMYTNRFNTDKPQYSNSRTIRLSVATSSTPEIIHYAMLALEMIYKQGYEYKKAGVIVTGIVPGSAVQQGLFDKVDRITQTKLMHTFDTINKKMGKQTLTFAQQSPKNPAWQTQRSKLSPCYTTRWENIWTIQV